MLFPSTFILLTLAPLLFLLCQVPFISSPLPSRLLTLPTLNRTQPYHARQHRRQLNPPPTQSNAIVQRGSTVSLCHLSLHAIGPAYDQHLHASLAVKLLFQAYRVGDLVAMATWSDWGKHGAQGGEAGDELTVDGKNIPFCPTILLSSPRF